MMVANCEIQLLMLSPAALSQSADFETLKVKEIKNGRLAMLAYAGFAAQVRRNCSNSQAAACSYPRCCARHGACSQIMARSS